MICNSFSLTSSSSQRKSNPTPKKPNDRASFCLDADEKGKEADMTEKWNRVSAGENNRDIKRTGRRNIENKSQAKVVSSVHA